MSSKDERVVQMQFDNEKFEKGVSQTLVTLDKLKQSLDFKDSVKSFSAIETAANAISLNGIADNVQGLADRFSTLGIIGMQVLTRMTDAAVDFGVKMAKSLSIDQISAGFQKYQENTKNVAAIVNQSGRDMSEVSDNIDQLSWYSDATSYDFNSMTAALASFTAQNIELEESIPLIMGIGNSLSYAGVAAKEGSGAFNIYSKAIAQGYVSLKEWRQLNTMKAATAPLKQQFIDAAKELGKLSEDTEVTIENFETTLTKGKWLDKEVMAKVFGEQYGQYTRNIQQFIKSYEETYGVVLTTSEAMELYSGEVDEFGKKAFQSAMEARTFTEAIDSVKDAASSQWNKIFELVFGNYEEATELWTEFGDTINDIFVTPLVGLKNFVAAWKKLGGRSNAIDAIKNSFHALMAIVDTVKEAFKTVFPSKTPKDIAALTNNFRHFTETLIPTPEALDKIHSRAEQLFRILRNLGSGLGTIGGAIGRVISGLAPVALKAFESIINLIDYAIIKFKVNLYPTIKEFFDGISAYGPGIKEFLLNAVDWLAKLGYSIIDFVFNGDRLKKIFDTIKPIVDKVASSFENFFSKFRKEDTDEVNKTTDVLDRLGKIFESLKTIAAPILDAIGKSLTIIKDKIKELFASFNLKSALSLVNGGILAGILLKLKEFVVNLTRITDEKGGFIGRVKQIIRGVQDSLADFQNTLKATALKQIATAIAILAGSLLLISFIDEDKLSASLISVTTLLGGLMASSSALSKMNSTKSMLIVGSTIKNMATGILILAAALKIISTIDIPSMIVSVIAIGVLMGMLVAVTQELAKTGKGSKKATSGIIGMSLGLLVIAAAVKVLSTIPFEKMIVGLIGFAAILGGLVLFFSALSDIKNALGIGIAITAMSAGILLLAAAIAALSFIKPEKLFASVGAISALMLAMALIAKIASGALKGAAGLLIMSVAIAAITPSLIALSLVPVEKIGVALLALAGVFAVIGLAALILQPLTGTILALSAALFLIGAAVLVAGAGLTALAAGITALSVAFAAGAAGIVGALRILIVGFYQMREDVALGIMGVIESICAAISGSITAIIGAVTNILLAIIAAIKSVFPALIDLGLTLILVLAQALIQYMPVLLATGFNIIITFLNGLADTIRANENILMDAVWNLFSALIEFVLSAIQTLLDGIPVIGNKASAALEDIKSLVRETLAPEDAKKIGQDYADGLSQGIESKQGDMADAGALLGTTGTNAFNTSWSPKAVIPEATGVVDDLTGSIKGKGMDVNSAFALLGNQGLEGLSGSLNGASIEQITAQFKDNYVGGIKGATPEAEDASEELADSSHTALSNQITKLNFPNLGKMIVDGLSKGLVDNTSSAEIAAKNLAKRTKAAAERELQIKSPSRVFGKIGYYSVMGFAKGLEDNTYLATGAAAETATDAINAFKSPLQDVADIIDGKIEMDPTIRPVLDLTEIQNGSKYLDSVFSDQNVNATFTGQNRRMSQEEYLAGQISGLRDDLRIMMESDSDQLSIGEAIASALAGMGFYVDGHKLGQLIKTQNANLKIAAGR